MAIPEPRPQPKPAPSPDGVLVVSPGSEIAPEGIVEACEPSRTFTPIDTSRGRFKLNVVANVIFFIFQAGIQLWFVRYLIDHLGVATYGLVPLATNITNYMAIITVALSGSVGRFLTIDLARGDLETANRTFNTSLFASIVLAIALIPAAGCLAWFAPSFLDIPEGEEMGTRFLLMCTGFAFLLNAVGSSFACSTFAKNRFDVQRLIDALGFLTQIGVVVALFTWAGGDLWYVGAGIAASAVVRQLGYQVSWRRLTPELSMSLRAFDRTRLREILSMGGWLTVGDAGREITWHTDLLVCNTVLGASAAGLYAPIMQVGALFRGLAHQAACALTPSLIARLQVSRTSAYRMGGRAMWALAYVVPLPVGLACGLGEPLLTWWLGTAYSGLGSVVILAFAPLTLGLIANPLYRLSHADNTLRATGSATLLIGVVQLVIAVVAAGPPLSLGLMGVALASAIGLVVRDGVFMPLYARHRSGVRSDYVRPLVVGQVITLAVTLCTALLLHALRTALGTATLVQVAGAGMVVAAAYLGLGSVLGPLRPSRLLSARQ